MPEMTACKRHFVSPAALRLEPVEAEKYWPRRQNVLHSFDDSRQSLEHLYHARTLQQLGLAGGSLD